MADPITSPISRDLAPVAPGTGVLLTVERTYGLAPMTYEWRGPGDVVIPGETGPTIMVKPTVSSTYEVVVSSPNALDTPVSASYMVVVVPTIGTVTITGPTTVYARAGQWLMEDGGSIMMEDSGSFLLET